MDAEEIMMGMAQLPLWWLAINSNAKIKKVVGDYVVLDEKDSGLIWHRMW